MIPLLLLATAPPSSVRAEPVEALLFFSVKEGSPSTSSGRTEVADNGTAIDAERAFAADAKTIGQWTAFRKWSTHDAVMFVPRPTNAHAFLKDRKDPKQAIDWWPTASWISCDGSLAVNTGGWKRPDGRVGYFTTVWQKQAGGGWRWILDSGDNLKEARTHPQRVTPIRASCDHPGPKTDYPYLPDKVRGYGNSRDYSLWYAWDVAPDGSRTLSVSIYRNGRSSIVVNDKVSAE